MRIGQFVQEQSKKKRARAKAKAKMCPRRRRRGHAPAAAAGPAAGAAGPAASAGPAVGPATEPAASQGVRAAGVRDPVTENWPIGYRLASGESLFHFTRRANSGWKATCNVHAKSVPIFIYD